MRRLWPFILILLFGGQAWAGAFDVFGTGPRAIAMGGAYSAIGEDISGLYYNVGALTQVHRLHAEFGYSYGEPSLTINGVSQDLDQNKGVHYGAIFSTTMLDHRISGGANIFIPDDHVMRFLVLPNNQPHEPLTANANHSVVCLVGGAVEVFKWMSVGGGINILGGNKGGINVTIHENSPSVGGLASQINSLFAPIAGLWFKPTSWLRIGAGYREKLVMELDLPNTIRIPPLSGFEGGGVPILRESELTVLAYTWSHFSPRAFELGVAAEPTDRLLFSANLTYMQWSAMATDAPATYVYVTGGLADIFPTMIGPLPPAPDFHDTLTPSFGFEGRPILDDHWRLDLRAGYRYRPTPVPDETGYNNYLDSNTHIFSSGIGLTASQFSEIFPRPLSLDGFVQYQYGEPRTYHKSSPTNITGDIKIEQTWWYFGGNLTLRF